LSSETIPEIEMVGDLGDEIGSFFREKLRERISPNTIATYGTALRRFADYLIEHGYPTDVAGIRDEHVTGWLKELHGAVCAAKSTPSPLSRSACSPLHGSRTDGRERAWADVHDAIAAMPGWAVGPCRYQGDGALWHVTAIHVAVRGRGEARGDRGRRGDGGAVLDALATLLASPASGR